MATLVPSLVQLRTEFNELAPGRDKRSDGWIGDPAHQERDSDHNPDERGLVHAIDVDADLGSGADMTDVIELIVARCKSGAEKRLTYIIWDRGIWSASRGWARARYTGDNPHTAHAHLSASDSPAKERDTSSWHLEEVPVALTDADKKWLSSQISAAAASEEKLARAAGIGVHNQRIGKSEVSIGVALQTLLARTAGDPVDEAAIAALVLGGLDPERIAAAIPDTLAEQVAQKLADRLAA